MDGILVLDLTNERWPVAAVSERLTAVTGFAEPDLLGRAWPPLWAEDGPGIVALFDAIDARRPTSVRIDTLRGGLPAFPSLVSVDVVHHGRPSAVCLVHDLGMNGGHNLVALALHDPVTGLATRASLQHQLEHALSRAVRHGHKVAVVYLDLDGFKAINDAFGHAAGDLVLAEVATRLRRTLRAHDLVARWGGDEFVIGLTDLGDDAAERGAVVCRHIEEAVREPMTLDGTTLTVGISVGMACFPEEGTDLAAVLAAADSAMYARKRSSRRGPPGLDPSHETETLLERARAASKDPPTDPAS